ncbi:hypothetical protein C8J56DRAFT_931317 [Mycena floridula]|nr:hypothetical protein C8J56DRAFT_931317 [Mycena floridula]
MLIPSSDLVDTSDSQCLRSKLSHTTSPPGSPTSANPAMNPKRPGRGTRYARPSTAPAREEQYLLPVLPAQQAQQTHGAQTDLHGPFMQTVNEDEDNPSSSSPTTMKALDLHASSTLPLTPVQTAQSRSNPTIPPGPRTPGASNSNPVVHTYDWSIFMSAYSVGRWNPHRTPNPPVSSAIWNAEADIGQPSEDDLDKSGETESREDASSSSIGTPVRPKPSTRPSYSKKAPASHFPLPSHRVRNSFSSTSSLPSPKPLSSASKPNLYIPLASSSNASNPFTSAFATPFADFAPSSDSSHAHLRFQTAAAIRLAGANVNLSPLILPSPEHELTDPMRGVNTTIPGSHPDSLEYEDDDDDDDDDEYRPEQSRLGRPKSKPELPQTPVDEVVFTPGGTKRKRLSMRMEGLKGFWVGMQEVDPKSAGSPGPSLINEVPQEPTSRPTIHQSTPPFQPVVSEESTDYFSARPASQSLSQSGPSLAPDIFHHDHFLASRSQSTGSIVPASTSNSGSPVNDRSSRLTRQASAPLPVSSSGILGLHIAPSSEMVASPVETTPKPQPPIAATNTFGADVPMQKDEQSFFQLGYLQPPNPPDELERRRALYKFNIWNTGSDINFDRIAHLAKLVFQTKAVMISLVDGNEQWFKSEWGINVSSIPRGRSFCGHAILQRDDEPMVVLDTHLDWRFHRNPLVTGLPNIRFYAGAPLRTQDGFNVGSLAILDDSPRDDFTPRHRHTLKEFAAIAMREMELWRDKIQLRIRDRIQSSMEEFSRECLEIDMEDGPSFSESKNVSPAESSTNTPTQDVPEIKAESQHSRSGSSTSFVSTSMDKVYSRAAKLIQRTLDVEDVVVMDVSHCEVLEPAAPITLSSGSPFPASSFASTGEGTVSVTMYYGDSEKPTQSKTLSVEEYVRLSEFFGKYPNGRVFEGAVPLSFRLFLPGRMNYALTVPIFNIDKRPFALLCAYNSSDHAKRFLEGHELSYLRAIGVIILSAVLKRRMILADKAKGLFISNISHELRTPLHGILAAAELLGESRLNHSQASFLQTVQACGTSLVETVNHVLDFTKLSGNSKSGGVDNAIVQSEVDLMELIEDAIDGCWIGHQARTSAMSYPSGIGSVYSPPKDESNQATRQINVEIIVDIGFRAKGWLVKCEKGGIRRILMNVFGNSLKFTENGFVQVMLRQVPYVEGDPENKIKCELTVLDTGKGISQNFLKNELFHPFSQENPLQTGTGLGLAIVHSIVQSESVNGKIDVWSEEGVGTEIKITFEAQAPETSASASATEMESFKFDDLDRPAQVSLVGFESDHRGIRHLESTLRKYLVSWWGFEVAPEGKNGDIVILNEVIDPVISATAKRDISRPFIILSSSRGSPSVLRTVSEHEIIGGFCRVIYKPGGPSRLRSVLNLCVHTLKIVSQSQSRISTPPRHGQQPPNGVDVLELVSGLAQTPSRRNSEKNFTHTRPMMSPRSSTAFAITPSWNPMSSTVEGDENQAVDVDLSVDPHLPTIPVGAGGTLLQSSVGTLQTNERRFKVLVVEDNIILRSLLVKWLSSKGYDYRDAVDGQDGVEVYERDGPFDIVLLDLSMPVLDGIGATAQIRQLELRRSSRHSTRILALTGMSSLEDKRKAFEAGVDGYLVKPVAFKTLDEMFRKLGIS